MLYNLAIESVVKQAIKISHKYRIIVCLLIETATYRVAFVYNLPCLRRKSRSLSELRVNFAFNLQVGRSSAEARRALETYVVTGFKWCGDFCC
jgi:hypothetical protein